MRDFISVAVVSVILTAIFSFVTFKIRSRLLRRHILATTTTTLENGNTYIYGYRHSFLNHKYYKLAIPENSENIYMVKETTYYNYRTDVEVNVFTGAFLVYSMHLRNVFYEEKLNPEEVE